MKQISDTIQIIITGGFAYIAIAVTAIWFVGSIILNFSAKLLTAIPRPGIINGVIIIAASAAIYIASPLIHDGLQLLEPAVYAGAYASLSEDAKTAAFEIELQKRVSPSEFSVIQKSTIETSKKIGCKPSDIYAVAYSECALNPFNVRMDGVAAGWIQFTAAGCGFVPGLTLEKVKAMCAARDINGMMIATEKYLTATTDGKTVSRPVDVYLAVFAPAKVGADDNAVLYEGYNNSSYYLNAGLDGWVTRADGRILNSKINKDGKITVRELSLCLEAKAQKLIKI